LAVGLLSLGLVGGLGAFALRASGQGSRPLFLHGPCAQGPFGHGTFSADEADKHVTRAVGWLIDDLKGTPDQEQKLAEIAKAAIRDLIPLKLQAQENHLAAAAILTMDIVDPVALEAIRAKQMELATQASVRITKAVTDASGILTPAQRVQLAERLKQHHG
jgi:Spy/CpxP family protein refolding chaperone